MSHEVLDLAATVRTAALARRNRARGTVIGVVERCLGSVAAIGAAVAILLARSSTLVNRRIAWTADDAAAAQPRAVAVHFADSTALFAAVDRFVEDEVRQGRVPGLALAVVHGSRIVHERGFGIADPSGRPVTPQTPFILGSMSKSFTATAILQLVDEGRVALDAPVARYLPWFTLHDRRAAATITVRQLLNHTSGLPKSAGLEIVRSQNAATVAQERRLLAAVRLDHAPGTAFEYSNANYWVLGRLLEVVTDTAYAVYVQRHIFAPLGMTRSYTNEEDAKRQGLAQGYRIWFGYPHAQTLPYYWRELAVGYLISGVDDMGRYLAAQMNGGAPVLSPATLRAMQTPPRGFPYAMGWLADKVDGVPLLWHTGAVGNYHGDMLIVPSAHWGVVWLANINNFALEDQLSDAMKRLPALLLGYEPSAPAGLGFRRTYALIVLACLMFAAWRLAQLIGLRHWRAALRAGRASGMGVWEKSPRHPAGALIDPGVSLGVLAGVPLLVGAPVSTLTWFVPDLTSWLLVNAFASALILAARLALALAPYSPDDDGPS